MASPSPRPQPTNQDCVPYNDLPLAIQTLVQNQLDQILIETQQRRWETWHHEDFRLVSPAVRETRKQSLLEEHPGLLSGPGGASLNQIAWQPLYILSITVPRADLKETTHGTDLHVCNVVWVHSTSGTLSLSFYNNHLEPTSSFRHVVTEGLSTKRGSQWTVGKRGVGFIHACRWLERDLLRDKPDQGQPVEESLCGVALRVGYSIGRLVLRKQPGEDKSRPSFTHIDLAPSTASPDHSRPESTLPSSEDVWVVELPMARHFDARVKLRLSVRLAEGQERPLVQADEVLVTVTGLGSTWTPEDLFSGIWSIFPPGVRQRWTIPSLAPNSPEIVFYKPRAQRNPLDPNQSFKRVPRFYFQGYHVPSAPLNRLGINYWGYLAQQPSSDGSSVTTHGSAFDTYLSTLSAAFDYAFRHTPDLAAEIAIDILSSDSQSLPYTFGKVMPIPQNIDEDGIAAYRAAFEAAFRDLDPPPQEDEERRYYPYLADGGEDEKKLIMHLGLHPVPVQAHVKQLLERLRAYPLVRYRGEALLLSSPGVQEEPRGADMLRAALSLLFPALGRDILSVRNFAHSWPRAAWNKETRSFVMGANAACRDHYVGRDGVGPCMCWVGMALCEAVASWREQEAPGACEDAPSTVSYQEALHALLRCTNGGSSDVPLNGQPGSSSADISGLDHNTSKGELVVATENQLEDEELEYLDPSPPSPIATASPPDVPVPTSSSPPAAQFAVPQSPKGGRPPSDSSLPQRLSRQQPSVLVITPLKPSTSCAQNISRPNGGSDALMLAELGSTTSLASTTSGPGHDATTTAQDVADMSDIWQDVQRRVNGRIHAMQTYHAREVSSLQDQLAQARAKISELEGTLSSTREEHAAALSAARTESDAVLAAKEEALEARDRALEAKDDMLGARNWRIAQLLELVRAQAQRVVCLQAEVRQWEARDKQKAAQLQQEMEGLLTIQRRVSSIMEGGRLRLDQGACTGTGTGESVSVNGRGAHALSRAESLKNVEEGKGERVAKRMRLQ
ncbi:hypothetical protein C8Q73DRAFT_835994 [Cubamyces lactineus]|nr:hypothetical protein C8Q73DRAFT_835994 [Cubamyces lactineus]